MISSTARRPMLAAYAILAALAPSAGAHAGLADAVQRVAASWRAAGAIVVVDKTRFLTDGETAAVVIPGGAPAECTTVLLLGARGLGFHVGTGETSETNSRERIASEAGAVTWERCGTGPLPHRLLVTSDSGRGALEMAVARSAKPLPHLHAILPERTEGTLGPVADAGALPPLPSTGRRAEIAEARARRDGATILARIPIKSGPDGAGVAEAALAPGCHVLTVFAPDVRSTPPRRRGKLDVDAEMRDNDDRLLARDRSDAPDARLSVCVGETIRVAVTFVGSPPDAPLLISHGFWSLQQHLPEIWGTETKARMAQVLLARHVVSLPEEPAFLAQGGAGTTSVPMSLEPGACYLAVVSLVQGASRSVDLRVHVGAREITDGHGIDEAGAVAAFCAGDRSSASAQVDAHGAPLLGWGLAVYRLQNRVWEMP